MWHRSKATSGIITLSSSCPPEVAAATAASSPSTWYETMASISAMEGFTLPGMMEEPGCTGGSSSSPSPVLGPEPSSRTSPPIRSSSSAATRSAPERAAKGASDCMA
jgi:hypothetical protein